MKNLAAIVIAIVTEAGAVIKAATDLLRVEKRKDVMILAADDTPEAQQQLTAVLTELSLKRYNRRMVLPIPTYPRKPELAGGKATTTLSSRPAGVILTPHEKNAKGVKLFNPSFWEIRIVAWLTTEALEVKQAENVTLTRPAGTFMFELHCTSMKLNRDAKGALTWEATGEPETFAGNEGFDEVVSKRSVNEAFLNSRIWDCERALRQQQREQEATAASERQIAAALGRRRA